MNVLFLHHAFMRTDTFIRELLVSEGTSATIYFLLSRRRISVQVFLLFFFLFFYWLSGFLASITSLWMRSCHATLSLAFECRCGLHHSIQQDRLILLDVSQVLLSPAFVLPLCLFKIQNVLMGWLHLSATSGCCATICDEKMLNQSVSPPR